MPERRPAWTTIVAGACIVAGIAVWTTMAFQLLDKTQLSSQAQPVQPSPTGRAGEEPASSVSPDQLFEVLGVRRLSEGAWAPEQPQRGDLVRARDVANADTIRWFAVWGMLGDPLGHVPLVTSVAERDALAPEAGEAPQVTCSRGGTMPASLQYVRFVRDDARAGGGVAHPDRSFVVEPAWVTLCASGPRPPWHDVLVGAYDTDRLASAWTRAAQQGSGRACLEAHFTALAKGATPLVTRRCT